MSIRDKFESLEANEKLRIEKQNNEENERARASRSLTQELHKALLEDKAFFDEKAISIELHETHIFLTHAKFVVGCDCAQIPTLLMLGRTKHESKGLEFDSLNKRHGKEISEIQSAISDLIYEGFNPSSDFGVFVNWNSRKGF